MKHDSTLESERTEHRRGALGSGGVDRRSVLEAASVTILGAGLAGCMGSGGTDDPDTGPPLESKIENGDRNYYSWFPQSKEGYRSPTPFEETYENDKRLLVEPTTAGDLRCRVENADPGIAGVEMAEWQLGEIESVTIRSRSERDAKIFFAIYLDRDTNGEFYTWEQGAGNRQTFTGFGKDKEAVTDFTAGGTTRFDSDSSLTFSGGKPVTLEELQKGSKQGIGSTTKAAVYAGVQGNASDDRQAVLEDVEVQTS